MHHHWDELKFSGYDGYDNKIANSCISLLTREPLAETRSQVNSPIMDISDHVALAENDRLS